MLNQDMPAKTIVSDCIILHNCIFGCQACDSQGMAVDCSPVFEERTNLFIKFYSETLIITLVSRVIAISY